MQRCDCGSASTLYVPPNARQIERNPPDSFGAGVPKLRMSHLTTLPKSLVLPPSRTQVFAHLTISRSLSTAPAVVLTKSMAPELPEWDTSNVGEPPSGTVTFLFTDLEGSTRLWSEYPEAMRHALARHDEILRDVIAAHAGYYVKTTG